VEGRAAIGDNSSTRRQPFTFEGTSLWGAAYYAGFRSQFKRLLGT